MSVAAEHVAETRKLAHALGVAEAELRMLAAVPAQDIRKLRHQITEALFRADRHHFARVAALSKAVPGAVAAKLCEAVLPPLIAARTAELLDPGRAVDLVGRLSDAYLADVAAALDAARAPEVVRAIPPAKAAMVGRELARREEWVVIGGFVAFVGRDALAAAVAEFDGGELLRIGFVLDDLDRLDDIGAMLADVQVSGMVVAAARDSLWREFTEVLAHLAPPRVRRLAGAFGTAQPEVRERFRQAAAADELDPAVLGRLES